MPEGVHYCRIVLYLSFDLAAQGVNVVLVIEPSILALHVKGGGKWFSEL